MLKGCVEGLYKVGVQHLNCYDSIFTFFYLPSQSMLEE